MKFSIKAVILFAAAALVGCLATAINAASPEEILAPFNDLLPPLLEDPIASANGTAKAVAKSELPTVEEEAEAVEERIGEASNEASVVLPAPSVVKTAIKQNKLEKKPLKKSYYQQQQLKQYDQHQNAAGRPTDQRPPKGVLPTLTPFPRHLKR